MIDIVANLKIDESKPERFNYFLACIKSLEYLTPQTGAKFIFNLEGISDQLFAQTKSLFDYLKVDYSLTRISLGDYGTTYTELLKKSDNQFVMNFIEDHFSMISDSDVLTGILDSMKRYGIDICKATFFQIEQNSTKTLRLFNEDQYGKYFMNDMYNHNEYQRYYGKRYYIGVNFITTRPFAERFWNRKLSKRPHEHEVVNYDPKWLHKCMIPNIEILCAIDDNHGEQGTRLLDRKDERFWKTFNYFEGCKAGSGN